MFAVKFWMNCDCNGDDCRDFTCRWCNIASKLLVLVEIDKSMPKPVGLRPVVGHELWTGDTGFSQKRRLMTEPKY